MTFYGGNKMAMVRITNGEITSRVPYSSYITLYKGLGFTIVGENSTVEKENKPVKKDVPKVEESVKENKVVQSNTIEDESEDTEEFDSAEEEFVEDILEKPLSQWTPDELKKFAEIKNIDTSEAKKVSQARAIVKKYLEEQRKTQL